MSFCPYRRTWLLIHLFSWKLIMGTFIKTAQENYSLIKLGQKHWALQMKTEVCLRYLAEFFLDGEKFQRKLQYIPYQTHFFLKVMPFVRFLQAIQQSKMGHTWSNIILCKECLCHKYTQCYLILITNRWDSIVAMHFAWYIIKEKYVQRSKRVLRYITHTFPILLSFKYPF
jgi:hypothetical protein